MFFFIINRKQDVSFAELYKMSLTSSLRTETLEYTAKNSFITERGKNLSDVIIQLQNDITFKYSFNSLRSPAETERKNRAICQNPQFIL